MSMYQPTDQYYYCYFVPNIEGLKQFVRSGAYLNNVLNHFYFSRLVSEKPFIFNDIEHDGFGHVFCQVDETLETLNGLTRFGSFVMDKPSTWGVDQIKLTTPKKYYFEPRHDYLKITDKFITPQRIISFGKELEKEFSNRIDAALKFSSFVDITPGMCLIMESFVDPEWFIYQEKQGFLNRGYFHLTDPGEIKVDQTLVEWDVLQGYDYDYLLINDLFKSYATGRGLTIKDAFEQLSGEGRKREFIDFNGIYIYFYQDAESYYRAYTPDQLAPESPKFSPYGKFQRYSPVPWWENNGLKEYWLTPSDAIIKACVGRASYSQAAYEVFSSKIARKLNLHYLDHDPDNLYVKFATSLDYNFDQLKSMVNDYDFGIVFEGEQPNWGRGTEKRKTWYLIAGDELYNAYKDLTGQDRHGVVYTKLKNDILSFDKKTPFAHCKINSINDRVIVMSADLYVPTWFIDRFKKYGEVVFENPIVTSNTVYQYRFVPEQSFIDVWIHAAITLTSAFTRLFSPVSSYYMPLSGLKIIEIGENSILFESLTPPEIATSYKGSNEIGQFNILLYDEKKDLPENTMNKLFFVPTDAWLKNRLENANHWDFLTVVDREFNISSKPSYLKDFKVLDYDDNGNVYFQTSTPLEEVFLLDDNVYNNWYEFSIEAPSTWKKNLSTYMDRVVYFVYDFEKYIELIQNGINPVTYYKNQIGNAEIWKHDQFDKLYLLLNDNVSVNDVPGYGHYGQFEPDEWGINPARSENQTFDYWLEANDFYRNLINGTYPPPRVKVLIDNDYYFVENIEIDGNYNIHYRSNILPEFELYKESPFGKVLTAPPSNWKQNSNVSYDDTYYFVPSTAFKEETLSASEIEPDFNALLAVPFGFQFEVLEYDINRTMLVRIMGLPENDVLRIDSEWGHFRTTPPPNWKTVDQPYDTCYIYWEANAWFRQSVTNTDLGHVFEYNFDNLIAQPFDLRGAVTYVDHDLNGNGLFIVNNPLIVDDPNSAQKYYYDLRTFLNINSLYGQFTIEQPSNWKQEPVNEPNVWEAEMSEMESRFGGLWLEICNSGLGYLYFTSYTVEELQELQGAINAFLSVFEHFNSLEFNRIRWAIQMNLASIEEAIEWILLHPETNTGNGGTDDNGGGDDNTTSPVNTTKNTSNSLPGFALLAAILITFFITIYNYRG